MVALLIPHFMAQGKQVSLKKSRTGSCHGRQYCAAGRGTGYWLPGRSGEICRYRAVFLSTGFQGALVIFLLELGMVTASRLGDLRKVGWFLVGFGVIMPLIFGSLAVVAGHFAGLSIGGTTVFAAMVSSGSYIAAPAAVRIALPKASPALYLTASLGITFPFNIALGIPIYLFISEWVASF